MSVRPRGRLRPHPSSHRLKRAFRVAGTLATPQWHTLALFRQAGQAQQGYARIINRSERAGTVQIWGTDDTGERRGPATLWLGAGATWGFSSRDLERGTGFHAGLRETRGADGVFATGFGAGLGDGTGDWRLELVSDLDIEPSAYIRSTADGFLTAVHDIARTVEVEGETVHRVPHFTPASNRSLVSWLRVANLTGNSVEVTIKARDDEGRAAPLGDVRLTLPAHGARRISARDLELGGTGLAGRLGDGTGRWRLSVTAGGAIEVQSPASEPRWPPLQPLDHGARRLRGRGRRFCDRSAA